MKNGEEFYVILESYPCACVYGTKTLNNKISLNSFTYIEDTYENDTRNGR